MLEIAQEIYSVTQLNHEARAILEGSLQHIWITGEISNLACPSSGHIYFSLKDQNAQVRCAMFRVAQRQIDFTPENGQQILAQAQVSLYEARGDFQLIIQRMQLAGSGALQIAFEKLKKKLAAEGLFDQIHKKNLPQLPRQIGVITSATGAAVRDVLKVLRRRLPFIPIIIYPTAVQGEAATEQIITAINNANQRKECDVLLLIRGGGSIEDLWAFNEEKVARAIFSSEIPIVSGIGHEVDFTIADFVAAYRAATPSAAAETVSPDQTEYQQLLKHFYMHLNQSMRSFIRHTHSELKQLQQRLRHPGQRLREQAQHLDQLERGLQRSWQNYLSRKQSQLNELARTLNAVSPLNTLQRGYAILSNTQGHVVKSINDAKSGDKVSAKLVDGQLNLIVLGENNG